MQNYANFWEEFFNYSEIKYSHPYEEVSLWVWSPGGCAQLKCSFEQFPNDNQFRLLNMQLWQVTYWLCSAGHSAL